MRESVEKNKETIKLNPPVDNQYQEFYKGDTRMGEVLGLTRSIVLKDKLMDKDFFCNKLKDIHIKSIPLDISSNKLSDEIKEISDRLKIKPSQLECITKIVVKPILFRWYDIRKVGFLKKTIVDMINIFFCTINQVTEKTYIFDTEEVEFNGLFISIAGKTEIDSIGGIYFSSSVRSYATSFVENITRDLIWEENINLIGTTNMAYQTSVPKYANSTNLKGMEINADNDRSAINKSNTK